MDAIATFLIAFIVGALIVYMGDPYNLRHRR